MFSRSDILIIVGVSGLVLLGYLQAFLGGKVDSTTMLTAALVLITVYYAIQTKMTVDEMRVSRRYQFMPSLRIQPIHLSIGDSFDIKIENVGVGLAKNIKGTIKIEPNGEVVEIVYPKLYPKESFSLSKPFSAVETYKSAEGYERIVLNATFEDIANNKHDNTDEFTLGDIKKIKNDEYTHNNVVDELRNIVRKLDSIKDAINR